MNNQSVHVQEDLKCLTEITRAGEKKCIFIHEMLSLQV